MILSISPIDGRYASKTKELVDFFSEFALMKYRTYVEIEYFIHLHDLGLDALKDINTEQIDMLRQIYKSFSTVDAQKIKDIESTTNHDVKAVEYFIKEKFDVLDLGKYKEFVHFGLTSQDINNTANPLMIANAVQSVFTPQLQTLIDQLEGLAQQWKSIPLLARTHGQAASPTTVGKEFQVYVDRLRKIFFKIHTFEMEGKFGGATGNFNAHRVAYPNVDWISFSDKFLKNIGLKRQTWTTQIDQYDHFAELFGHFTRLNTVLVDLAQDVWTYISMDYFGQKVFANEVGSSAMPHKVNPIDFENAEGNLKYANAIFQFLSTKLPVSRLQRDLTDSTVSRNIGVPFSHSLIAYKSILKGLSKLILNESKINEDLDNNWAVVSEAIQTVLRRENYANPYESLKALTRGNQKITKSSIHEFIDSLDISNHLKEELKNISPHNYTGYGL